MSRTAAAGVTSLTACMSDMTGTCRLCLIVCSSSRPTAKPRTPVCVDRGPIGLVIGCLKDERHIRFGSNVSQPGSQRNGSLMVRLNDARTGNQNESITSDCYRTDFYWMCQRHFLPFPFIVRWADVVKPCLHTSSIVYSTNYFHKKINYAFAELPLPGRCQRAYQRRGDNTGFRQQQIA